MSILFLSSMTSYSISLNNTIDEKKIDEYFSDLHFTRPLMKSQMVLLVPNVGL